MGVVGDGGRRVADQRDHAAVGTQDDGWKKGEDATKDKGSGRGRVRSPTRPAVLDTKRKAKKQRCPRANSLDRVGGWGNQKGGQRRDKEEKKVGGGPLAPR
jgi:hypothetical protein